MNFSRCTVALSGERAILTVLLIFAGTVSGVSAAENSFRLTQIDGTVLESASVSVDSQGQVVGTFDGGSLSIDQLVQIESGAVREVNEPANPRLFFAAGGTIALSAPGIVNGRLAFDSSSKVSDVPLESVRAIVWEPAAVVTQLIQNPPLDSDAVVVRQGDQLRGVEGVVEGLDGQQVTLRYKGKSRKIGLGKVAAIVMANLQLKQPEDQTAVTLMLRSGGSIEGRLSKWQDEQIVLSISRDVEVAIPAESLAKMLIKNERLVYLSDLDPVSAQQRAMFTFERPWRRDRSVEGNPLSLFDPQTRERIGFEKGIGTHSWSSLVFANDRELDRFMATVGIDSETRGRGNCRMIVRGDGIELWSGQVTGVSGPQTIDVSIRGIELIELEVAPGEEFDLADHANWCDARFVKSNQ